ncbi:MAG: hypothetical protein QME12_04940 [Nanoarchaeota archaeon]|nr:hypothetical protein [Nanoarchaeota archaeon]
MKTKTRIKAGLAAICAAASLSAADARADDFVPATDNAITIGLSAGYQDNNLADYASMDFSEGHQIRGQGESAVTFYPGVQLVTRGLLEINNVNYSDGNGKSLVVDAGLSVLWEWAHRAETYAFNIGGGLDFDCRHEAGNYLEVPIEKTTCGAGPMFDLSVDSEYANFGLSYSFVPGITGNNIQGYFDLLKHKLRLGLGFHLGPVDVDGYVQGEYNGAMDGTINRENLFLYGGTNAKVWLNEHAALQLGYEYIWLYGDQDGIDSNTYSLGFVGRF